MGDRAESNRFVILFAPTARFATVSKPVFHHRFENSRRLHHDRLSTIPYVCLAGGKEQGHIAGCTSGTRAIRHGADRTAAGATDSTALWVICLAGCSSRLSSLCLCWPSSSHAQGNRAASGIFRNPTRCCASGIPDILPPETI